MYNVTVQVKDIISIINSIDGGQILLTKGVSNMLSGSYNNIMPCGTMTYALWHYDICPVAALGLWHMPCGTIYMYACS